MVVELRRVIEAVSRDASVNDRLVKQIETAAAGLVADRFPRVEGRSPRL